MTEGFRRVGKRLDFVYYKQGNVYFHTGVENEKEVLTAAETWNRKGGYVFISGRPDESDFLSALTAFLEQYGKDCLLLWLENPESPWNLWRFHRIPLSSDTGGERYVKNGKEFCIGEYRIFLPGESRLTLEAETGTLYWKSDRFHGLFETPGITLTGIGTVSIALTGEKAGTLQADFLLPKFTGANPLEQIGAGIRYYASREQEPYSMTAVVLNPRQQLVLHGCFQLEKPPEQGCLCYFDVVQDSSFDCDLATLYGHSVSAWIDGSLTAEEEKPGLSFAKGIRWFYREGEQLCAKEDYYLTYTGAFLIKVESDIEERILGGMLGTEYISLQSGEAKLVFHPNHPSFASLDASGKRLEILATTAWVSFAPVERGGGKLCYYSQPPKSALYGQEGASSGALNFLELPAVFLAEEKIFPWIPYLRFSESNQDQELLKRMELECLAPERAACLLDVTFKHSTISDGKKIGTTPQGLMVSMQGNRWEWLAAANNRDSDMPDSRLIALSERLQIEFQSSRLFLPVSARQRLMDHLQGLHVQFLVEDWTFYADFEHWREGKADDSNTVILFKYLTDRSVDEMMGDQRTWNFPELSEGAAEAYAAAKVCCFDRDQKVLPLYRNFYRMIMDRSWCGILILNCPLSCAAMPDELKLLIMDLKEDELYGHHIGIHANEVCLAGETLIMKRSRYFGLVDYQNRDAIVNEGAQEKPYDFLTKRIVLEIKNSTIHTFASESELMLNRLFDVPVQKVGNTAGNCLTLDGSYQKTDGVGQYVFGLRECSEFLFRKSMLKSVEITAVRMNAEDAEDGMAGRFFLNGRFRFAEPVNCDLFAYGRTEKTGDDGYLVFQGLLIELSCKKGSAVTKKVFSVLYEGVSFDSQSSAPRKRSMPTCLPASLEKIIRYEKEAKTPKTLGYRTITCPVEQGTIDSLWYGIVWKLSLGGLGENAGGADFALKLLCAWGMPKEGEEEPPVYIGVKMPGMSEYGFGVNLQGFVKLDFKSIELLTYEKEGGVDYQLCFRNFSLQALGMTFPPGKNNIYLFGEDGKKIGWYAAWQEDERSDAKE